MMINILSQVVELRNGESGLHVQHIQILTGILLERVAQKTEKYHFTASERSLIAMASSLHDIGKIAIDEAIQMILRGECGAFHPLLIECLLDVQDRIQMELNTLGTDPSEHFLTGADARLHIATGDTER